jgi:hypothetical protein
MAAWRATSPPEPWDELCGFYYEEKDIDTILLSVFPDCSRPPVSLAAGLCLCKPTPGGFSYTIIGSAGSDYFDATAEGLPRDSLCVCGKRIQVTFLSNQNSANRQYHFLVIPRGIEALVATGWRPGIERRDLLRFDEWAADPDLLSTVGFDWGSRLRFIGDWAFRECSTLSSFFIPASVEQIGDRGFEKCWNLSSVTIANGSRLKSIGGSAFYDCGRLQLIDLPPNLENLSSHLFHNCGNLCFLPLGSLQRLSKICHCACQSNRSLRSVVIPGSVVEIWLWAFDDCVSLVEVDFVLPSKLASIGTESFRGCKSLRQFQIVGSVTEIKGSFLQGSGVHEVGVDSGNSKFKAIEGLIVSGDGKSIVCYFGADRDVRIEAKIEIVGSNSFEKCQFLRSVTFETGSQLELIETKAFQNCESLELVQFGGPCPTLSRFCFNGCKELKEVLLESPSDRLPVGSDAFTGCSSLKLK